MDLQKMKNYIVFFHELGAYAGEPPSLFRCSAEEPDHAEEQCWNAYPGADVVWVFEGSSVKEAFIDYYGED